jgi:hypothetical protein
MLLALVLGGRAAAAQAIKGSIVSVGIAGIDGQGGLYRAGAWVPVQVRLQNRTGKQFVGRLGVETHDIDGDKTLSVGPKFILQPTDVEGRLLWTYYWPRPDDDLHGIGSVLVLDETGSQVLTSVDTPDRRPSGSGLGSDDYETSQSLRYVLIVGRQAMGWPSFGKALGGTETVRYAWAQNVNQLPDDAKGLDGVDLIVWQGDGIKPSDIPPEFQLKAMLEWVAAGGHLLISVGSQGEEFLKAGGALGDALPITFTGTREVPAGALAEQPDLRDLAGVQTPFIQAVGTLKPGARPIAGGTFGAFAAQPLAVTGRYGRGAVTVLTFDAGHRELDARLTEPGWMRFWTLIAGWQPGDVRSASQAADLKVKDSYISPRLLKLGDNGTEKLPSLIDVTEVTMSRLLVALLFLAVYWLFAGPVGHLLLRYYRVVHWSWWVFGGTVVVATALAGVVVFILHVSTYDVRHKSFVLGTVNSPDVSVVGFYGVYAPVSGGVQLQLPAEAAAAGAGLNYLAPLALPVTGAVTPFADPQSYQVTVEHPAAVAPVFRSTLKKMQARWNGPRGGIDGDARYTRDALHELAGTLVNNSGYDLEDVRIVVHRPSPARLGTSRLYNVGLWKQGESLDLEKRPAIDKLGEPGAGVGSVEHLLQVVGWRLANDSLAAGMGRSFSAGSLSDVDKALAGRPIQPDLDLLYFLLDLRTPDRVTAAATDPDGHTEVVRGVGRLTDCTKLLRAAGALIIARAGSIEAKRFVPNPAPLTVNGKLAAGKGEVLFAWALPVTGQALEAPARALGVEPPRDPAPPARGPGRRGRGAAGASPPSPPPSTPVEAP